jgi:hypothetical protein
MVLRNLHYTLDKLLLVRNSTVHEAQTERQISHKRLTVQNR